MAKRINAKNIDEMFVLQVEGNTSTQTCRLLKFEGEGDWATATFADSYYPGGEWGQWKVTRYKSKWFSQRTQKRVTVIK